jgi:hypothetical protein
MPGPLVLLSPEYAGSWLIVLAVSFLVAAVVGIYRWRHAVLLARQARPSLRRSAAIFARPALARRAPAASILGRRRALRAPPLASC